MAIKVKANNASKAKNRVMGIFVALGVILLIIIVTMISTAENKKTISVVRIKEGNGVSANALITEEMVEPYDMYYKEYKAYGTMKFKDGTTRSKIITWDNKDLVLGKRYSAYYQREGTVLFWDSTTKEQTQKNSYLYSMAGELLNIQMTTVDDFGDMVVPGDTLNIRAVYTNTTYDLPSEEAYQLAIDAGLDGVNAVEETVNEMLFSEVSILDMLNGEGNSIFDLYYYYISLGAQEQEALLKDDAFLESVTPASILLEVTSEQVEKYMTVQAKDAKYQITLLPRESSSSIVDSLGGIQEALAGVYSEAGK